MTGDWTADDIMDLTGKTAVVTGANSGLGRETTRELARNGAHVVMACRNEQRADAARESIESDVPDASLEYRQLDLANLDEIAAFAVGYRTDHDSLDLLVNNAGVMAIPRQETADGFEKQFGVNHLGHFALTGHLLDRLRAGDDARVVTVSSGAHRRGRIDFDDLHHVDDYGKWRAYGQSKLANLLFAFELQRRLAASGLDVASLAAHPGYAATDLQYQGPKEEGSWLKLQFMRLANALIAQSPARGALPILYAATAEDVTPGSYYGPSGFLGSRGSPTEVTPSARARDEQTARRLWTVSEELTGLTFDLPPSEIPAND